MKRPVFTLLVVILINQAVFAEGFYKGENLITPYVLADEKWDVLSKEEGSVKSMLWRSKEKAMKDVYFVHIFHGDRSKPKKFKRNGIEAGKKACESFESTDHGALPNKNYESIIWSTKCLKENGMKVRSLEVAIRGKDSSYYLQKIWRDEISDSEFKNWLEKLKTVYVCDTRKKNKLCPSGYKKVDNK